MRRETGADTRLRREWKLDAAKAQRVDSKPQPVLQRMEGTRKELGMRYGTIFWNGLRGRCYAIF